MPNRFNPISGNADISDIIKAANNNFAQLDSEAVTKVFRVAANTPGFIEGKLPDGLGYGYLLYSGDKVAIACYISTSGTPVLKVAKDGYDALTATDDQLIFNSTQNILKIVQTGTATINVPSSANDFADNVTITHNLGFIPKYTAYVKPPGGYVGSPTNAQLPFFQYVLYDSANPATVAGWHINGLADVADLTTTTITFRLSIVNNSASNIGNWTFNYDLLQESIT